MNRDRAIGLHVNRAASLLLSIVALLGALLAILVTRGRSRQASAPPDATRPGA